MLRKTEKGEQVKTAKIILNILAIATLSMSAYACAATPGIDSPLTIDGNELQIVSAELSETYETIGGREYSPKSESDTLLIVKAEISADIDDIELSEWDAAIRDENGRIDDAGMRGKFSGTVDEESGIFLEWLFAVDEDAQSFTLLLRDQQIDLEKMLESSSPES
jgi:hypothetical protein